MTALSRPIAAALQRSPLPALHIMLWGLAFAVMVALLVGTPTLNLDDLAYVDAVPMIVHKTGLPHLLLTVLLNADIGIRELRSYGLARAIQVLTITWLGKDPAATYAFIVLLHAASGFIVCFLMQRLTGDKVVALFATFAWVASPAVLPLLKVQHHFLYLIVPYYPLLLWLACELSGYRSSLLRICLLCASWMLGEGAIIPMMAGVSTLALSRRDWGLTRDGGIAFLLLALYMGYQILVINHPDQPQRFHLAAHGWDINRALRLFGWQLFENARAILGLKYWDAEIGKHVASIHRSISLLAFMVGLVLAAAACYASRITAISAEAHHRQGTFLFIGMSCLSLAIYFFLCVFGSTGFAVRYTAAFYALLPLALIAAVALYARPSITRACAGTIAAAYLMLSIGLLDRAEKLVNVPNRLLLDNLPKGTAVIVHHQGWAADRDGRVNNGYPGLVATFAYGLPDPKRSAWTLDHMLQLYKGIVLGTACRTLPDGKIVVLFQGAARGVFDADSVLALGLPDPYSSMPTRIDLSEVCTPAD